MSTPAPSHPAVLPLGAGLSRRAALGRMLAISSLCGPLPALAQALSAGPQVFRPEGPSSAVVAPQETPLANLGAGLQLGNIAQSFWDKPRELWLYRQDTRESLKVVYWKDGQLNADGYWKICALLRDVHQNIMTTMDPALLDVLRGILGYYEQYQWPYPLVITSGFRTLKTNSNTEGAARNSMHLYGKAADVYLPGVPVKDLARLGLYFQRGGVGFYPDNGFVHLDTGTVRSWVKTKPVK